MSTFRSILGTSLLASICLALAFLILSAPGDMVPASAQEKTEARNEDVSSQSKRKAPISIVIEEGQSAREILVGYLKGTDRGKAKVRPLAFEDIDIAAAASEGDELVFTLVDGGATFESMDASLAMSRPQQGRIYIPAMKAGAAGTEGTLRIHAGGRQILGDIRVASVPSGGIAAAKVYFSAADAAVLKLTDNYIVVDESKLENLPEDSVTEEISADGSRTSAVAGLCIRVAWGPGKVKYNGFGPWDAGQRYSYKPESSNSLVRGSGSEDNVDAVYRYSWGCGTALKVPDSCTLTINSNGSRSTCCNAAMAALGHTVKWVNPSSHGFPYCPLSPF